MDDKLLKIFDAILVTDKGLVIEEVKVATVEEVIPFLTKSLGLNYVTHFVIRELEVKQFQ